MKCAVSFNNSSIFSSPVVYSDRLRNLFRREANPGLIAAINADNSANVLGLYFLTLFVVDAFSH